MRLSLALLPLSLSAALVGCASSPGTFGGSAVPNFATAIQGSLHTGSKGIASAHVYLLEVATTGDGQPALSLLPTGAGTGSDAVGNYVLTDGNGNFTIPDDYACSGFNQVYLLALGGTSGPGVNPAAGLMAAIGGCPKPLYNGVPTVNINEVTTVAAAYAMAGFTTDATHASSSASALARVDAANAFLNAGSLASTFTGTANTATPAGNGVVPRQTINTLADILAACIQSSGAGSAACTTLFGNARNTAGVTPGETASAILNIAHHPGANIASLFGLAVQNAPFTPSLPVQPNDFTLGITFSGGGLNGPYAVAIDAAGDAWFANLGNSTISKLSSTGAPLSPSAGFNAGAPIGPVGVAIDLNGDAWVADAVTSSITKYSASGALLTPAPGYTGGGMSVPQAIASDGIGSAWVVNYTGSVSKFSNGGTPISPAGGYTGGGIGGPVGVAIDASGSIWIANSTGSPTSITKLTSAGVPVSPATGFLGGGLNNPFSIAIDANGFAWVANFGSNSLSKFSPMGEPVSPVTGYTGGGLSEPFSVAIDGGGNAWVANSGLFSVSEVSNNGAMLSPATGFTGGLINGPQAIAIDGSGNVWIANADDITVTELIGAAVPVVTPLAAGIQNNTLGTRP